MNLKFPKAAVINAGYLGAILIFLGIGIIAVAVFMPKLVKPVYTPPTPNLEAKFGYSPYVAVGDQWSASVALYENSRATAHDIHVIISSPAFGKLEKTDPIIMPYTSDDFNFTVVIPESTQPGHYSGTLVITTKDANQSVYNFNFTVVPPAAPNTGNDTGNLTYNATAG